MTTTHVIKRTNTYQNDGNTSLFYYCSNKINPKPEKYIERFIELIALRLFRSSKKNKQTKQNKAKQKQKQNKTKQSKNQKESATKYNKLEKHIVLGRFERTNYSGGRSSDFRSKITPSEQNRVSFSSLLIALR